MRRASGQRGNIFAMLFASVALVGVLGASAMNVLGGPVSTVQRVTQKNLAQTHMMLSARVLLNVATDFDSDGMSEAPAYRTAGALPAPVGGGLLPDTLGLALTDPWGNAYGYCVYDHGTDNASPNRLTGDNTGGASVQTMVALVASGPNKAFETTCAAYSGGPVSVASAGGSDDLILHYSYTEAAASSAGLWTLNASDQNKAELKDNGGAVAVSVNRSGGILEAVAVSASTISAPASAADTLSIGGGLLLDVATGAATVCGAVQVGSLRLDASKTGLEICDGAGLWPALRALPSDGDKGDITVSASGASWVIDAGAVGSSEIAAGAVTFSHFQDIASNRLLGRSSAGAGSVEEISVGAGLTLSAGTLSASVASETDPQVSTLTAGKWCAANVGGTAIDCTQNAPAVAVADGDKGDITVSASGASWTIDAGAVNTAKLGGGAVTFSRIQNINPSRLLGRWSSTLGSTEEISVGAGLTLSAGTLSASVASETDPQVSTLTAGKWCRSDGSFVICDVDPSGVVPAARLWRVYKTNAAAVGNYVSELKVFDAGGAVTLSAAMLSHSGLSGFNAAALIDNNTAAANGFHVDSSGAGSWLQIDFGAGNEKALTRWDFSTTSTVNATWDVQYFDGSAWVPVYLNFSFSSGAGWKSAQKQNLAWQ